MINGTHCPGIFWRTSSLRRSQAQSLLPPSLRVCATLSATGERSGLSSREGD